MRFPFRPLRAAFCSALLLWRCAGAWSQGPALFPPTGPESTGEKELAALAQAYPDRVSRPEQRDGDWAVQVDGEWFSWAHGRILPEPQRADWEKYSRFRFYPYPVGVLPPVPKLDDEAAARLKKLLAESRINPPRRSETFLERLYKAGTHAETEGQIQTVDFLGFSVRVHTRITAPLAAVARELEGVSKVDPEVTAFLRGLSEIDGYNYRDVAGTATRSYHSYGLAVDLIPRSYHGKATYWRWVMDANDRWWETPYDRRWMVPAPVIAAFERQGFVWGGKWLFFDTMHFEYRPEIFILAGQQGAS